APVPLPTQLVSLRRRLRRLRWAGALGRRAGGTRLPPGARGARALLQVPHPFPGRGEGRPSGRRRVRPRREARPGGIPMSTAAIAPPRRGPWGRWVALLAQREAGTSLALFRIACGGSLLCSVGSVVLHGMVPVIWLSPDDGGLATTRD